MRQRVLLSLLLCGLLLSQTLGLLHSIVHVHPVSAHTRVATHGHQSDHDHDHANESGNFLTHWFADLFSGHASDNDCRAYDQCSHADTMLGTPTLVLPLVLLPFVFSVLAGLAVARWHALFQARGPPLIR